MKPSVYALIPAVALTTTASARDVAPDHTATTSATFISDSEIRAAIAHNNTGALSDSPLRVVAIDSKYNVGVAVVRRAKVNGRMQPDALVHSDITEVYQIIEGEGVMVTGGSLQAAKPVTAAAIVGEIGPSMGGQSIVGGTSHHVASGDIVIVPPRTPHGFVDVTTPRIVYMVTRIDPNRVLELRSKSQ